MYMFNHEKCQETTILKRQPACNIYNLYDKALHTTCAELRGNVHVPFFGLLAERFSDQHIFYEQLKWKSLKKRRRDSRIIMLYKCLKGAAIIPTNDLVTPIRHVRKHRSLAFQTPFANTDIYKRFHPPDF